MDRLHHPELQNRVFEALTCSKPFKWTPTPPRWFHWVVLPQWHTKVDCDADMDPLHVEPTCQSLIFIFLWQRTRSSRETQAGPLASGEAHLAITTPGEVERDMANVICHLQVGSTYQSRSMSASRPPQLTSMAKHHAKPS